MIAEQQFARDCIDALKRYLISVVDQAARVSQWGRTGDVRRHWQREDAL
jgi:hypothetical protein